MNLGDEAFVFELPASKCETVNIAELIGSGPIVLLFIPFAYTSVCTTELCRVGAEWPTWDIPRGHVFGISADSPFVTSRWRAEEDIPFRVLSDFNRKVARAYDVLDEKLMGPPGVAKRSAFVIDEDGRIAYRWVSDDPGIEPDYDEIRDALERIS